MTSDAIYMDEEIVIGTILSYPNIAREIVDGMAPELFTRTELMQVFIAATQCSNEQVEISMNNIRTRLIEMNKLDQAGGDAGLVVLARKGHPDMYQSSMLAMAARYTHMAYGRLIDSVKQKAATEGNWDNVREFFVKEAEVIDSRSAGRKLAMRAVEERIVRADDYMEEAPSILSVNGNSIGTKDSIVQVVGEKKAGKSSTLYALWAGTIPGTTDDSTFGISVKKNHDKKLVIIFDTEQSKFEEQTSIRQAFDRAGIPYDEHPSWLMSVNLKGMMSSDMINAINVSVSEYSKIFGGVHMVIADSGSDLAYKNDMEKSDAMVKSMMQLSSKYDCLVMIANHFNPTEGNAFKSSGHLGTILGNKSSGTINVTIDGPGTSIISFSSMRRVTNIDSIRIVFNKTEKYWERERANPFSGEGFVREQTWL